MVNRLDFGRVKSSGRRRKEPEEGRWEHFRQFAPRLVSASAESAALRWPGEAPVVATLEDGLSGGVGFPKPLVDGAEGFGEGSLGRPAATGGDFAVVRYIEFYVGGTGFGVGSNVDVIASDVLAEFCELLKGNGVGEAPSDVEAFSLIGVEMGDLIDEKVTEVADVEDIANLLTLAAKADVAERTRPVVGGHPQYD